MSIPLALNFVFMNISEIYQGLALNDLHAGSGSDPAHYEEGGLTAGSGIKAAKYPAFSPFPGT